MMAAAKAPEMKLTSPSAALTLCASVFCLCACDNKPATTDGAQGTAAGTPAKKERVADPNLPEKKVEITGNDQMKFDVALIEAKPNQKVTVTLKNVGSMPKVSMGHNWVLLELDVDPQKFMEAGTVHMGRDFIAPEFESKVIAHTKLLGPAETDTISFAAPEKPGDYTYLCSFPGHYTIGMKGILKVQ
jgi:azurin